MELSPLVAGAPGAFTAVVQLARPLERGAGTFFSVLASALRLPDSGEGQSLKSLLKDPRAEESLRGAHRRIVSHLRAAGIDLARPMELFVDLRSGTVSLIGPHPDGEAVEDALRRLPQFDEVWRGIGAGDEFAVRLSDRALDPIA
jgi:hypothetical protein